MYFKLALFAIVVLAQIKVNEGIQIEDEDEPERSPVSSASPHAGKVKAPEKTKEEVKTD